MSLTKVFGNQFFLKNLPKFENALKPFIKLLRRVDLK